MLYTLTLRLHILCHQGNKWVWDYMMQDIWATSDWYDETDVWVTSSDSQVPTPFWNVSPPPEKKLQTVVGKRHFITWLLMCDHQLLDWCCNPDNSITYNHCRFLMVFTTSAMGEKIHIPREFDILYILEIGQSENSSHQLIVHSQLQSHIVYFCLLNGWWAWLALTFFDMLHLTTILLW